MALGGPGRLAELLAADAPSSEVPRRVTFRAGPLGRTGVQVSALCFGGAHWGRIEG
jgi:hypothetical protein